MNRRLGKTTPGSSGDAAIRLAIAREYAELAELKADESRGAARNAAAGNAVLAGIAAADAICLATSGVRSASNSHADAVALLASVAPALGKHLGTLVSDKTNTHYGTSFTSSASLRSYLRAMNALIAAAQEVVRA